jgi:hypothetical protein
MTTGVANAFVRLFLFVNINKILRNEIQNARCRYGRYVIE